MTVERPEQKPQVKACPYWARYAEVHNNRVIVFCSYKASNKGEEQGRIWEGPQKTGECLLGYGLKASIFSPSVVICKTDDLSRNSLREGLHYFAQETIDDGQWNRIVEACLEHSQNWQNTKDAHTDHILADKIEKILFQFRPRGNN